MCRTTPLSPELCRRKGSSAFGAIPQPEVSTLARQHFLYFFPLPQGQGSLRPTECRAGSPVSGGGVERGISARMASPASAHRP